MIKQQNATFKDLKQISSKNNEAKYPIYKPLKKIGQGSFGKAYLVQSQHDQKRYILKKILIHSQSQQAKQSIFQQVKLMQNLSHVYIIKYIQSFIEDKSVCIVMDYAQNGDLQKYLDKRKKQNHPLLQEEIITWFIQLCLGLKYIHQRKILHRDLKADNIFITAENQLKIGDFGVSKIMNQTYDLAKTKIGTPHIMAPQIFQNMKYNQKSDIWSLGCVLYKLQMLKYPFQSTNILAMMAKMQNKKIQPIIGSYSDQLKQLTYSLLSFQPKERPSVHKILQTPFLKRNLTQILQNSISIHMKTNNSFTGSKKICESSGTVSLRKMSSRKSISSLSGSVLTPLSKKNQNLTGIIQNGSHTSQFTANLPPLNNNENNYQKNQNLKMIQFKQNYPILMQQNKQLKQDNKKLLAEKQQFSECSQKLFDKIIQDMQNLSKQQILQKFRSHILGYVYK